MDELAMFLLRTVIMSLIAVSGYHLVTLTTNNHYIKAVIVCFLFVMLLGLYTLTNP